MTEKKIIMMAVDNIKLGRLKHLFVTVFLSSFSAMLAIPSITDITMEALCPGQDECSLAIYLSGFQQAITGVGSVMMTPVIGNLSDIHGRKALLTLPLTAAILPLVILAYSREKSFFYAYYALRTVTSMVGDASINCLALAYVYAALQMLYLETSQVFLPKRKRSQIIVHVQSDVVTERSRATAFGILTGLISAAFVCGTLAARFLSPSQTFQVAALLAMAATVYMRVFLPETMHPCENANDDIDQIRQPILKDEHSPSTSSSEDIDSTSTMVSRKTIPTVHYISCMLKSSKTLSQVAIISFFYSLAEGGLQASLLYFLKAQFHFSKNQFADIMLIIGVGGIISQLLLMPMLVPVMGEERLLSIGLFVAITNILLNSIAWSAWVPYVVGGFSVFFVFSNPCMRSIASKQVGADEQGKAQGSISGISSFANIVSPLIFSPLTALFLSETAPFHFPGFSLVCIGFATAMAFIQSLMIRPVPRISTQHKVSNNLASC